jgi:hypothetical protein
VPDVPVDAPADTEEDSPPDVEPDGAPGAPVPFTSLTSGGARFTSPSYRLEVFIAPVGPTGKLSSTNHEIRLGPAGARSN